MVDDLVTVRNKNGIHLRLASEVVKAANMFRSKIFISKDSEEVNAKSILGVAGLGAEFGMKLRIRIEGEDEKDAIAHLVKLFDSGFSEVTADG